MGERRTNAGKPRKGMEAFCARYAKALLFFSLSLPRCFGSCPSSPVRPLSILLLLASAFFLVHPADNVHEQSDGKATLEGAPASGLTPLFFSFFSFSLDLAVSRKNKTVRVRAPLPLPPGP